MRKRANPKVINLPDGRSFTSRWERISRKQLEINIRVTRARSIGRRRNNRRIYFNLARSALEKIRQGRKQERKAARAAAAQSGSGLGSNLAKAGFELGSKPLGSEFGKKLINKGIDNIPNVFKFAVSKIRNKNAQRAMNSEIANMIVNEAQNRAKKKYNSDNLFG